MRFLLVDTIDEIVPGVRATGVKNVTFSEDFLAEHFPERPIMPGMMIVEALVQLADWLVRRGSDFETIALATSFERVKFRRVVRPGDQINLAVELLSQDESSATAKATAHVDGALAASATIGLSLEPLDRYVSQDRARLLFELLLAHARPSAP